MDHHYVGLHPNSDNVIHMYMYIWISISSITTMGNLLIKE